jgi:cell division inhibitor SulA
VTAITQLLDSTPLLWKGRQANRGQRALPSGHANLDTHLPGNGWPLGAISEVISPNPGLGELRLLFPVLADLGREGQWVILVDPPWIPYPPSLQAHGLLLERLMLVRTHGGRESLWACEQALGSGRGGAVLAWPEQISFTRLRRLQMAAESSAKLGFLFRPESASRESSPAALRLQLKSGNCHDTLIHIIKCRGNRPAEPVRVPQPFSTPAKHGPQTAESSAKIPSRPRIIDQRLPEHHARPAANNTNTLAGHTLPTTVHRHPLPGTKLH